MQTAPTQTVPALVTKTVFVTPGDIFRGRRGCALRCPLAHATNRAFRYPFYARVHATCIEVEDSRALHARIILPEKARRFVKHFDRGWWPGWFWCRPFEFPLQMPGYLARP